MTFRSLSWYANIQGVPISFNQNIKQTQKIVKLKENLQRLNVRKFHDFLPSVIFLFKTCWDTL